MNIKLLKKAAKVVMKEDAELLKALHESDSQKKKGKDGRPHLITEKGHPSDKQVQQVSVGSMPQNPAPAKIKYKVKNVFPYGDCLVPDIKKKSNVTPKIYKPSMKCPKLPIERCEYCKKRITNKMKDAQQVIYASAEHTLYATDNPLAFGDRDEMFSGVFCCHNCYSEVSGINRAYEKGLAIGEEEREKLFQQVLHWKDLALRYEKELAPYRRKKLKEISKIKVTK